MGRKTKAGGTHARARAGESMGASWYGMALGERASVRSSGTSEPKDDLLAGTDEQARHGWPSARSGKEPQAGVHFYDCAISGEPAIPLLQCTASEVDSVEITLSKPLRVDALLAIRRGKSVLHQHLPAGRDAFAVDRDLFVLRNDGVSTITLALVTGQWHTPRLAFAYARDQP